MLKKFILLDLLYYLIIITISLYSYYYGREYTLYHTDLYHWNFQLETILSYINGKELYKEIFLQYGEGYVTSLKALNYVYKIDIYSLGIIVSVIYALRFFLIYKISLLIIHSKHLSLILTLFIFLSISYTQVPWPDFFSGFCLLIFFYFLFLNREKKNFIILIFSSFLLFLTIYFRNTYLLNFLGSSIIYLILNLTLLKINNKYVNRIIIYTYLFIIIYVLILYVNNNLFLWFSQGLGLSDHFFGTNDSSFLERIKNYIYYILRAVYHLLFPSNLSNLLFSICFVLNIIYLAWNIILNKKTSRDTPLIIFISLYGLCGFVQTLSHYEIMRYINASISVYFVSFYFISNIKFISEKKKIYFILFCLIIYFFNIAKKLPTSSHPHIINNYPKENYEISNFKIFGKKKFTKDYILFYEDLKSIICEKDYIYNFSYDRSLNFICHNLKKTINVNNLNINYKTIKNLQNGLNKKSRIIISSEELNNLKLINIKTLPKYFRYTLSDNYMKFHPNKLYIYE